MKLTVVIPFKSLTDGKSRLAGALDAAERRSLCSGMLQRTLQLARGFEDVIVVSDDERVLHLVDSVSRGVHFLRAQHPRDLNLAIDQARSHIAPGSSMVVIPTDLVRLDRATLDEFLSDRHTLAIAPDRAGKGTNLLHLPATAVGAFRFKFGPGSFRSHLFESLRIGCEPSIFHSPAAAFDLDTPDDLSKAVKWRASASHVAAVGPERHVLEIT